MDDAVLPTASDERHARRRLLICRGVVVHESSLPIFRAGPTTLLYGYPGVLGRSRKYFTF